LVVADHENKPNIASGIARKWFDADKVDMIANLIDSGSEYIHSITSLARPSGTVRPSAFAVLRLMISSTFVDC
jgi:branched-chain amino acid transport system substrate-binding protein